MTMPSIYGEIDTPEWTEDLICRSLREYGEWAYVEHSLFAMLIAEGDRVWDGGAFLGTFGLGAAQTSAAAGRPPSFLLAIEPSSDLAGHLAGNLTRNAPCRAAVETCAVGAKEGRLRAKSQANGNHGATAFVQETSSGEGAPVACQPLSQLRRQHGDYDCLKLDIEGMELDALRGDFQYIKTHRPVMWVECNENAESLEVLGALKALDYDLLYVAFPAMRKDNFRGNPNMIYPMAYEAALVAAPPERLALLNLDAWQGTVIVRPVRTHGDLRQAMWATPRWSMPEWVEMSNPELIALLGRERRGERKKDFLVKHQ